MRYIVIFSFLLVISGGKNQSKKYHRDENGVIHYLEQKTASITLGRYFEQNNVFLQLSNDGSGADNEGLSDQTKLFTIFLLNIIACILCCSFVQAVIMMSKRMNIELSSLRKNYKQYQSLQKFKEFRRNYAQCQTPEKY